MTKRIMTPEEARQAEQTPLFPIPRACGPWSSLAGLVPMPRQAIPVRSSATAPEGS